MSCLNCFHTVTVTAKVWFIHWSQSVVVGFLVLSQGVSGHGQWARLSDRSESLISFHKWPKKANLTFSSKDKHTIWMNPKPLYYSISFWWFDFLKICHLNPCILLPAAVAGQPVIHMVDMLQVQGQLHGPILQGCTWPRSVWFRATLPKCYQTVV